MRVSVGVDRKANTLEPVRGCSVLEVGDICLFKDDCKRRGALVSDVVVIKTAGEGRSGNGERTAVSTGADRKTNTREPVRATGRVL